MNKIAESYTLEHISVLASNSPSDALELNFTTSSTIRCAPNGSLVNVYFLQPEKLEYKGIPIVSKYHSLLLESVSKLGSKDQYQVNHLFAQIFCIYEDAQNKPSILQSFIGWNHENQQFSLSHELTDPLLNFISRESTCCEAEHEECRYHTVNASHFSELEIPHSEHLLVKYLQENSALLSSTFTRENSKIVKMGVLLYSSIDSCDVCQNLLIRFFDAQSVFCQKFQTQVKADGYQIEEDHSWLIVYISSVPCKKSSYREVCNGSQEPFFYDKLNGSFFYQQNPLSELTFPCSLTFLDLSFSQKEPLIYSSICSDNFLNEAS